METMNIALPEVLKDYVQERVQHDGYSSVSEYVRELIRADQKQRAMREVEVALRDGLASGPAVPVTKAMWAELRAGVKKVARNKKS